MNKEMRLCCWSVLFSKRLVWNECFVNVFFCHLSEIEYLSLKPGKYKGDDRKAYLVIEIL